MFAALALYKAIFPRVGAATVTRRDDAFEAHLLNHSLQPPLRAHQCDGCDDFGVEDSKGPVLQVSTSVKTQSGAWTTTIPEGER